MQYVFSMAQAFNVTQRLSFLQEERIILNAVEINAEQDKRKY